MAQNDESSHWKNFLIKLKTRENSKNFKAKYFEAGDSSFGYDSNSSAMIHRKKLAEKSKEQREKIEQQAQEKANQIRETNVAHLQILIQLVNDYDKTKKKKTDEEKSASQSGVDMLRYFEVADIFKRQNINENPQSCLTDDQFSIMKIRLIEISQIFLPNNPFTDNSANFGSLYNGGLYLSDMRFYFDALFVRLSIDNKLSMLTERNVKESPLGKKFQNDTKMSLAGNQADYILAYSDHPLIFIKAARRVTQKGLVELLTHLYTHQLVHSQLLAHYFGILTDGCHWILVDLCENKLRFEADENDQIRIRTVDNSWDNLKSIMSDIYDAVSEYKSAIDQILDIKREEQEEVLQSVNDQMSDIKLENESNTPNLQG